MIANARRPTCASCRQFPLSEADSEGVAQCSTFTKNAAYDYPACPLYEAAKDVEARRVIAVQLHRTHNPGSARQGGITNTNQG